MRTTAVTAETDTSTLVANLEVGIRGLLYVYIFCLPFKWLLLVERNGFIILLVLLALWGVVNRSHFFCRTPIDLALLSFLGWVAFTIPFAAFPLYSLKEFGKLIQQVVIFYAVVCFFKDNPHKLRLLWLLIGQLLVVSVYGIGQFISMIGTTGTLVLVESVMSGEIWLTTYLVMLVPLALVLSLFEGRRPLGVAYGLIAGLAILCLLLTVSRAGLIALGVELIALGWLLRRKMLIVMSVSFMCLILVFGLILSQYNLQTIPGMSVPVKANISSISHRISIWKFTVARVIEHPWLGIGFGKDNFKLVYGQQPEPLEPGQPHIYTSGTHNTYLDMALGVGIPGLLFFLWLMRSILTSFLKDVAKTEDPVSKAIVLGVSVAVMGMLVRLCFDHMFIGTLAVMFWALVGLATVVVNNSLNGQGQSRLEKL